MKKVKNSAADFLRVLERINKNYGSALKVLSRGPSSRVVKTRTLELEQWTKTFFVEDKEILDELAKK